MGLSDLPKTNSGLYLPPNGYDNWDEPINENFKTISTAMDKNANELQNYQNSSAGYNWIINPQGKGDQRAQKKYIVQASNAGIYTLDRWRGSITHGEPGTMIIEQSEKGIKVTVSGLSGNYAAIQQWIEDYKTFEGKVVTASFKVSSEQQGTVASYFGVGSDGAIINGGGRQTSNEPTIHGYTGLIKNINAAVFEMQFFQNGIYYIDEVQVVFGSKILPFVPRPYAEELALCQRYYQKSYRLSIAPGTISLEGAVSKVAWDAHHFYDNNIRFNPPMRAIPTVRFYHPYIQNTEGWSSRGANEIVPIHADNYRSEKQMALENHDNNLIPGGLYWGQWVSDAEIY